MIDDERPRSTYSQELQAFERWRHLQADALWRMGYPEAAAAFLRLGSVQWAGWQARAELAAQDQARHGHVVERMDGVRMRCGGPSMCEFCQAEQVQSDRYSVDPLIR